MNFYVELIGYAGTGLVLLSMMMTSVTKLRWLNLSGSLFSMVYAFVTNTWPVFVLNLCLSLINAVQLFRLRRKREEQI